jgi:hypothetical protein
MLIADRGWVGMNRQTACLTLAMATVLTACKKKSASGYELYLGNVEGQHFRIADLDPSVRTLSVIRTGPNVIRFSLGITTPVHLLSYRDRETYPAYCRRDAILARIEALAVEDHCRVSSTDLGGSPTALITCDLPRDLSPGAPACPAQYVAQLWQERWPGSTEDYELEMYARVRAQCARERDFETFHASDATTTAAETRTSDVIKLLAACKDHDQP